VQSAAKRIPFTYEGAFPGTPWWSLGALPWLVGHVFTTHSHCAEEWAACESRTQWRVCLDGAGLCVLRTWCMRVWTGRTVYEWEQSLEEVNVYIAPPPGVTKHAFDIKIDVNHLRIGLKGNPPFLDVCVAVSFSLRRPHPTPPPPHTHTHTRWM
jgi:hypothetical protein